MKNLLIALIVLITSCTSTNSPLEFEVIDTDFSKGRLNHEQTITIKDLEKFHGHTCDGLVLGSLAMQQALKQLYPNQPIDRTNLRIVSKPSPCLTDVAVYLTGGRYQFNTFYVDTSFSGLYIVQRIDSAKTVVVSLNEGIKPIAIDSLGKLAIQQKLSPCGIDSLKALEDKFTLLLLESDPNEIFTVLELKNFTWKPLESSGFVKTDIINKFQSPCNH